MRTFQKYNCQICKKGCEQKSHHETHINTEKHKLKREIKEEKLNKKTSKYLNANYGTVNIKDILDILEGTRDFKNEVKEFELESIMSSKDSARQQIHEIHNYLRNNGVGYGMNALKLFTLFYGLKKIEMNGHFEKTGLDECCRFSKILNEFEEDEENAFIILNRQVLKSIHNNPKIKYIIFSLISDNIKASVIYELLKKIEILVNEEKKYNFQLAGKIYEYFIGRDQTAISELGAYFTDRPITDYIYNNILKPKLDKDKNVQTMIDPFGGSGGFTIGYLQYLINNDKSIDWKSQLQNVYHYDMNRDVVKYAMLEFYCLTGEFPKESNMKTTNSFRDDFSKNKFNYICTNPPYGGDKIQKTEEVTMLELLKSEIEKYIEKEYKKKKVNKKTVLKLEDKDKKVWEQYNQVCNKLDLIRKINESQCVRLYNSSNRFQLYAKSNGIDISKCKDKESVSLLMMMNLLAENGTAVGVLKEGVFFDNKYKHIRKHLIENFNVIKVVSIDSSQFENTSTKTSIIMFSNTGKTESIKFSELIVTKDKKTEAIFENGLFIIKKIKDKITGISEKFLTKANYNDIVKQDYTLNYKKYNIKKLEAGKGYEMKKIGEEVKFLQKSKRKASFGKQKGKYNFYTSSETIKKCDVDDYKEQCLIIGTGGNSSIHLTDSNFSCSTDNIIMKSTKINYHYYIIQSLWKDFVNSMHGSTIKHVTNNMLKNYEIPIPKSQDKLEEWVTKIDKPYNKVIKYKKELKELEEKVQNDIQKMLDENETEEVELGNLCEFIKTGKHKNKTKNELYPYYGTNKVMFYIDNYDYDGEHICIARKGDCHITLRTNKFNVNDDVVICKPIEHIKLIYYIMKINIYNIDYTGSTVKGVKKSDLIKLKMQIPKNKKLIDNFNPIFKQINTLKDNIPKQEKLYQQYLQELKQEAIKN